MRKSLGREATVLNCLGINPCIPEVKPSPVYSQRQHKRKKSGNPKYPNPEVSQHFCIKLIMASAVRVGERLNVVV